MSGPIVVDVGNSRVKWGLCSSEKVWSVASLPAEEAAWNQQWLGWNLQQAQKWVVCGVQPTRRDAFVAWLKNRGHAVEVIVSNKLLPLKIEVESPEKVGIDRLLNAIAANRRRQDNVAAVIVDAGTAVTVDYVDGRGVFLGGTILPGFHLMARSLHEHTAVLPFVEIADAISPPGGDTVTAIQAGVYFTVVGGIERIISEYQVHYPTPFEIFLTGGDAERIASRLRHHVHLWPEMTLDGILHSRAT